MKGQLELPIIGLLATVTIVLGILVVSRLLTTPLVYVFEYEQETEKTELILTSLLTSTEDGKTIHQIIGENIVFGTPTDSQISKIISQKLDKLVESKCYKVYTPSKILAEKSGCGPKKYTKETLITLPFNQQKLTEKITLVIN
ncbi:MAG: hypothetical protein QXY45_00215 [Candidatus Aenigmatarchaeota archaeon]